MSRSLLRVDSSSKLLLFAWKNNVANPQKENGYTAIANEILEALAKIRINGEARQVLDVILRKTYGYHKKQDRISLSQFAKATGLDSKAVCRAITKLTSMDIVIKISSKDGNIYVFQKDNDKWSPVAKVPVAKQVVAKGVVASGKNVDKPVAILPHTKERKISIQKIGEEKKPLPRDKAVDFFNKGDSFKRALGYLTDKGVAENLATMEFNKFISYWTETNSTGKKQRWEMEKVFDINRRLGLWLSKVNQFNNNKKGKGIIL